MKNAPGSRLNVLPVIVLIFALLAPATAPLCQEHEHHPTASPAATENPDPMAAMEEMQPSDRWMTMLHGFAYLTYNRQGGPSGAQQFQSENHFMLTSMRRWWGGRLSLLGTFTLEPATVPLEGSPELFQRGETYKGTLLVDRQHPHDLVLQLAARWDRKLSERVALGVYLAPVGEPAVGPTAYPHRLSASFNPITPLAHHNQDSTHLSSDVVTVSLGVPRVTFEASAFHGREPDDKRWNIDQGTIDSYSGRVKVKPARGLTFQVSAALRENPEELEEGSQTRQTASLEYVRKLKGGFIASSLIVGRNLLEEGPEWGNGLEATWRFKDKHVLSGRIESVDRDLVELTIKQQRPPGVDPERTVVQALTAGYARDMRLGIFSEKAQTSVGAQATFYKFESALEPVYGDFPVSAQVFLRIGFGTHH